MKLTRQNIQEELPKLIKKHNTSAEYLAYKLEMSYFTIRSWIEGRRTPTKPVIDKLNSIFNGFRLAEKTNQKK